ncbi:MAG TPA: hypothetical protein V6C93_22530 [Allocoleopsis sp.]
MVKEKYSLLFSPCSATDSALIFRRKSGRAILTGMEYTNPVGTLHIVPQPVYLT